MRQATITHSSQLRQLLTARRRALHLSQTTLATKIGVDQTQLSNIETGRASLTVDRLLPLLNVLGLDLVLQDRNPTNHIGQ